jgi:protein gp37
VNAINGCSLASPGCTNCYAMKQAHRVEIRRGLTMPSKGGMVWTGEVRFAEEQLLKPLRWKRPRRIFWNAHGDTFHDAVPDAWIDRVFAVCALTPQHTHMILTKRSARMRAYLSRHRWHLWSAIGRAIDAERWANLPPIMGGDCTPVPNVWLGVSVEDQTRADERIPDLLNTPAAKRFISAEPLLGPIDLTRIMEAGAEECFHMQNATPFVFEGRTNTETRASLNALTGHYWGEDLIDGQWEPWVEEHAERSPGFGETGYYKPLDWVIAGGESGPGARPMHPDWARSLRDQCAAAGVAFHFKQWGEHTWVESAEGDPATLTPYRAGKKAAGRLLDGIEHNGVPA